jgi:hypothetical protein
MIFASPVKAARWSPEVEGRGKRLAVCTRSGAVYIWDGELGWVDDGEDVADEMETRGGLTEGIGIPTRELGLTLTSSSSRSVMVRLRTHD